MIAMVNTFFFKSDHVIRLDIISDIFFQIKLHVRLRDEVYNFSFG